MYYCLLFIFLDYNCFACIFFFDLISTDNDIVNIQKQGTKKDSK